MSHKHHRFLNPNMQHFTFLSLLRTWVFPTKQRSPLTITLPVIAFVLLLFSHSSAHLAPSPEDAITFPPPAFQNMTIEYMDPTLPPLLPTQNPKCSLLILQQDFSHTISTPPTIANYTTPSDCPAPWSRIVLELSASVSGLQKDRIAAIWLDKAEILRATTPLPMSPGVFWHVRKDITRYTALLLSSSQFTMMLENSNDEFPGVYSVNVSLHFYRGVLARGSAHPADLIIPVSRNAGGAENGFWFKVENESEAQVAKIVIPRNTYRAILEVYVSHHGDDEYWYANPLQSTGLRSPYHGRMKANGGFRQVVATIDGKQVGSVVPLPLLYPGSINPYFWAPIAAIRAYNHPSYDIELTPFVGLMVDGRPHEFGLTVRDSQRYWLIDANLHLWLDAWSDQVEGGLVRYRIPPLRMHKYANWKNLDGKSLVQGQVIVRFSGWVSSSEGNTTTSIRHKIKFKSHIEVEEKGNVKNVDMESIAKKTIRTERDDIVIDRVLINTETPLHMTTVSSNGRGGTKIHKTKLTHGMMETRSVVAGKGERFSTISDRQESEGSVLVEDGKVVWGNGDTKSIYKFRDDKACYLRTVNVVGGKVKEDVESASCSAIAAL